MNPIKNIKMLELHDRKNDILMVSKKKEHNSGYLLRFTSVNHERIMFPLVNIMNVFLKYSEMI